MTTPAENRRRLAEMRAGPSKGFGKAKGGARGVARYREEDSLLTSREMLFAAKMHRPGGAKTGQKPKSHVTGGAAPRPGVRKSIRVNKLG